MLSSYQITILTTIGIYAILVVGLNVIVGYAGQISLGHAAFFGIGAYTAGILTTKFGISPLVGLIAAMLVTGFIGFLLGFPSIRVRDDFLAITTIGMNFIVESIFLYTPFLGGALGIGGIPRLTIMGVKLKGVSFLMAVVLTLILCMLFVKRFVSSWSGLAAEAIKENEKAALSVGISIVRYKLMAFVIGSAIAGIGGAYYAYFVRFISPSDFNFPVSVMLLSMLVVGGIGTLWGPIVGAFILGILPEIFRPLVDYRMLLYSSLLILMIRFQPQGLLGEDSFLNGVFSKIKIKRQVS